MSEKLKGLQFVFGLHSVRSEMFIDRSKTRYQLRSEERNGSEMVKLYLNPDPPNGARWVLLLDL